jgi:AcrR family transcriptional regulator
MSKINNKQSPSEIADDKAEKPAKTLGRKRDHTRDAKILEATIEILAEAGFDGMTMDMVAARAKAGKATMYRRWSSKTELVRDALTWMNRNHLELDLLPDTGTLRNDLLALLKPQTIEESERKLRVLAGLGSFFTQNPEAVNGGIFDPWVAVNKELMRRAVSRGEIPIQADIEMACQVIVSMASYRGLVQRKTFDTQFYTELIEGVVLPALKGVREK